MKAWHCVGGDFSDFYGGHLLVFAETAGKAKHEYLHSGPWDVDGFTDIRVRRAPAYDGMRDRRCCIETNDDIGDDRPPFYSDSEDEPDPEAVEVRP